MMRRPHVFLAALCTGIAAANAARVDAVLVTAGAVACSAALVGGWRVVALLAALLLVGWWWGSVRLGSLDGSALRADAGTAARSLVLVTAPPRRSRFQLRVPARMLRFGGRALREPILLELPPGRAPPQGALLDVVATLKLPRDADSGFDEATWLRRHGVHVVAEADRWRIVGPRRGAAAIPDRLRAWLARAATPGIDGERRAIVLGIVLGDDDGLSEQLRDRFRAAGLYHLLAVSGQNVLLVALGVLGVVWLLALPRWLGHVGALTAICAYVTAVGAQPSVVRAGIAGALGCVAWLLARMRDRWWFLLVGALVLLAWNPYVALDAGFQLSFAAVAAIFTLVPRFERVLEGYPIPRALATVVAVPAACGLVTAPISWFHFHAVSLVAVPANVMAAPVAAPLLGLAFATALASTVSLELAGTLAWLNGWCAAYLAACARLFGALPFAQIRSGRGIMLLAVSVLLAAAYAWRRGDGAEARVPADRQRSPEDPNGARAAARALRR